jgi:hypothetical protein
LLWTALLDGQKPWELDVFESSEHIFQQAKIDVEGFVAIALDSVRGLVPEERASEVGHLISSLLCAAEERDLTVLLPFASQKWVCASRVPRLGDETT